MAGWSKDAHKVGFVTIYYPFHPCYQQTLTVIRVAKAYIIVKLTDGAQRGIPTWMTDQEVCKKITISPYPYCSHKSLMKLKEVLFCLNDKRP
jgi:hypothetical protein